MKEKPAEARSLLDLKTGVESVILKITGKGAIRQRLLEMGVTRGTSFKVERYAPLGDPIEISIKGYYLAIRKEEAANILVEPAGPEERIK